MSLAAGTCPDVEGFVLAGGASSRMGRDKALLKLGGRPLIAHACDVLQAAGLTAQIAGARSKLNKFAPVIPDASADGGPLAGICSALAQAKAEWAVFLPVDLPLMAPSLIQFLVRHARISGMPVTLASINGFAQTFPAVVRRNALPVLESELRAGRSGCFRAFRAAGVSLVAAEMVAQSGHVADARGLAPFQWFLNVNTREDLDRAEAILIRHGVSARAIA